MEDDDTQDKSPNSNIIFKIKTINQILSTRKPPATSTSTTPTPRATSTSTTPTTRATSTSTTLTTRKTKTNTKKPAPKNNYKII